MEIRQKIELHRAKEFGQNMDIVRKSARHESLFPRTPCSNLALQFQTYFSKTRRKLAKDGRKCKGQRLGGK